jgi:hypothetical protein
VVRLTVPTVIVDPFEAVISEPEPADLIPVPIPRSYVMKIIVPADVKPQTSKFVSSDFDQPNRTGIRGLGSRPIEIDFETPSEIQPYWTSTANNITECVPGVRP